MVAFSKFLTGQRGSQQLLDTNEYTYNLALASRLVVFLAFVPREHIESAFEDLSVHVAGTYPELMAIVNYFEQTYLGLALPDGTRAGTKFGIEHWNHHMQWY